MTKSRLATLLTSFALILGLFVVLPGFGADENDKGSKDGLYRPLGLFTEVVSLVRSNYVEKVELKPLLQGAFAGMTEAMDPFSEYIPPDKMAAFEAARAARRKADDVEAGVVLARRAGYPVVVSAVAGGPAALAGLQSDDILEKVGDRSARTMALWEVEAALAGKPGGKVQLFVVRDSRPHRRTLDVVRTSWSPAMPSSTRVSGELVVTLPTFGPGTAKALAAILEPLDRTRPLIVDVRGNAYGSFEEAARAAALFVPAGPLAEMKGRKIETTRFVAGPKEQVATGRVVVLVDSGTAGPAELFAAALRESAAREAGVGKAALAARPSDEDADADPAAGPTGPFPGEKAKMRVRLVGEPTFGMGITQEVVRLASGGALKLTVGKLRTAGGRSLSPRGLEPDDRVYHLGPDEAAATPPPPDPFLQRGLKVLAEGRPEPAKTAS